VPKAAVFNSDGESMRGFCARGFQAHPESAEQIRAWVVGLLQDSVSPDELGELLQGVSEAVANAIRHGSGPIQMHVEVTERAATVRVRDCGGGFDPKLLTYNACPAPHAESGRGLFIMRQVCDSIGAYVGNSGCMVSLTKALGRRVGTEPG